MNQTMKRILNITSTVIVVLAVVLAVLLVGVRIIGLQVFTVLSGSMEPEFHTGALIYVKKVDPAELEVRDVITFMLDEHTVATHRIIEIVPDEEDPSVIRFRTQGDANNAPDGTLVHCKNVIGSPVFSIPLLGYVSAYIQEPPGTYVAISVAAIFLVLVFLPDLFSEPSEEEKKKAQQKKAKKATSVTGQRPTPQQRGQGANVPPQTPQGSDVPLQQPARRNTPQWSDVPLQQSMPRNIPTQKPQIQQTSQADGTQHFSQNPNMIRVPRRSGADSTPQTAEQTPLPRVGRRPPEQPPEA